MFNCMLTFNNQLHSLSGRPAFCVLVAEALSSRASREEFLRKVLPSNYNAPSFETLSEILKVFLPQYGLSKSFEQSNLQPSPAIKFPAYKKLFLSQNQRQLSAPGVRKMLFSNSIFNSDSQFMCGISIRFRPMRLPVFMHKHA